MRAGFTRYRVAIAFTLPTLLVGAAFSPALVSFPIIPVAAMLVTGAITILLALPLFLILRGIGWLGWVPATAAGMLCGALVGLGGGSIPMGTMTLGAGFGLLLWWVAIFRNPRYPAVPTRIPWAMLLLLPLACLWIWYWHALDVTVVRLVSAPSTMERNFQGELPGGRVVTVGAGLFPVSEIEPGSCFFARSRPSLTRPGRIYTLEDKVGDFMCGQ